MVLETKTRKKINWSRWFLIILLWIMIGISLFLHKWEVAMWQGVVFLLQSLIFSKEKQIDALMVLADRTTELLNIFAKEKDMWKEKAEQKKV